MLVQQRLLLSYALPSCLIFTFLLDCIETLLRVLRVLGAQPQLRLELFKSVSNKESNVANQIRNEINLDPPKMINIEKLTSLQIKENYNTTNPKIRRQRGLEV